MEVSINFIVWIRQVDRPASNGEKKTPNQTTNQKQTQKNSQDKYK